MRFDHRSNGGDEPDDFLDEEFPLGDGTADTAWSVVCPYCGEVVELALDPGSGATQEYVEDCQVCCRPMRVVVTLGEAGEPRVDVSRLDG